MADRDPLLSALRKSKMPLENLVHAWVEDLLERSGYTLLPVADSHLCCGSAGTYSILQPELSMRLRDNKLEALQAHAPDVIATANIGCHTHMAGASSVPVVHWIELLAKPINKEKT